MITTWRTLRLAIALALVALLAGSVGVGRVAARPIDEEHAKVSVVVVQAPPTAADILTYTIKATNRGDGWAHYAKITVPFDAAALKLLDVQFSGTPAWVAASEAGSFEIRTERLNSGGGATTATLRFARQPGAATNAALADRLSYAWRDNAGGGRGRSNLPADAPQPFYPLAHREVAGKHSFSSNLFLPGEPVVFWYQTPSGSTVATEVKRDLIIDAASTNADDQGSNYVLADADGAFDLRFSTGDLSPGEYMMVARGDISGLTAVGMCQLHK
jgi:hypothetical protein